MPLWIVLKFITISQLADDWDICFLLLQKNKLNSLAYVFCFVFFPRVRFSFFFENFCWKIIMVHERFHKPVLQLQGNKTLQNNLV